MSSCARTSAVVHRSKDSNSHLKCKDTEYTCCFYVLLFSAFDDIKKLFAFENL